MRSGRPFLQIPGPTNVPERVLRAMDGPVIDHRSPEFAQITHEILPKLRAVFGTTAGSVALYPGSGTGAWEAALVNVFRPGDRLLSFNCGYFAEKFAQAARDLGFVVDEVPLRWGQAISPAEVESRLRDDTGGEPYRGILVMHNETSTGVMSPIGAIRQSMDAAGHKALLIVDAVSSLASVPFRFDEWQVDVALTASQKGLMLPPGLAILCVSDRAVEVGEKGGSPRSFFDWRPMFHENQSGFFPYTPATQLLVGLRVALQMLVDEEGLSMVYARHRMHADGVRAALHAWSLSALCEDVAASSETVTAVVVPEEVKAGDVVRHAHRRFGLSLGVGLGQIRDRVFRIGHLGSLNELELLATLSGIELSFHGLGHEIDLGSGVRACQRVYLSAHHEAVDRVKAAPEYAAAP